VILMWKKWKRKRESVFGWYDGCGWLSQCLQWILSFSQWLAGVFI